MPTWTKVSSDSTPVRLANLVGRLQRVLLAQKISRVDQILEMHPLDADTHTAVKAHLADLKQRLQGI